MTKVATLNISFFCCNKLLSLLLYEDTWKRDVVTGYLCFFNETFVKNKSVAYVFPTEYRLYFFFPFFELSLTNIVPFPSFNTTKFAKS